MLNKHTKIFKVDDIKGWGVTNVAQPRMSLRGDTWLLQLRDGERINEEEPVYWIAPLAYLENKVCITQSVSSVNEMVRSKRLFLQF